MAQQAASLDSPLDVLVRVFPFIYLVACLAAMVAIGLRAPARTVLDFQIGYVSCFMFVPDGLVVDLAQDGGVQLNGVSVSLDSLRERLRTAYGHRADRFVFFQSSGTRPFSDLVAAVDVARGAGARAIALGQADSTPMCRALRT